MVIMKNGFNNKLLSIFSMMTVLIFVTSCDGGNGDPSSDSDTNSDDSGYTKVYVA
jgi:hypothetical protein